MNVLAYWIVLSEGGANSTAFYIRNSNAVEKFGFPATLGTFCLIGTNVTVPQRDSFGESYADLI